jgi:hypothetical protein
MGEELAESASDFASPHWEIGIFPGFLGGVSTPCGRNQVRLVEVPVRHFSLVFWLRHTPRWLEIYAFVN